MAITGTPTTTYQSFTEEMQTAAFNLGVGLFGIPMGTSFLQEISNYMTQTQGATIDSLYEIVLASSVGTNAIYYPTYLTDAQFAERLANNLLGTSGTVVAADAWTAGKDWVVAALQGGMSRAEVAKMAVDAVAAVATTDTNYGAARQMFDNKVTVAEYYTFTAAGSSTDVTALADLLDGVTNNAATVTTANTAIAGGAGASTSGTSFTLTTSVDNVSGTSYNDTISGIVGSSGTYAGGDAINAYGGTDTLNLLDDDATAAGLVSLDGVEVVNVRVLSGAGQTELNAVDWSGVATLTNASSLANGTLDVSGLSITTNVVLYGNTDINIGYNLSATGATASATLINAGSAGTATTIGSASATNTANFDFDEADAGFISAITVDVQGSLNLARLEAGSNVTSYAITGTGNAALVTDDSITSFNASAAAGNIDITFSGASDVVAVGGAGNDTFRFGTTFSNGDSVNGGAGNDVVTATVGGFNRNLNTTAVESATITFTEAAGGTLNASASTVAAFTLGAGTAGNAGSLSQLVNAAVITVADDDLGDVTLDYASGAATTTINLGSATGAVAIGTLAVTDVAAVSIVAAAGSAGAAVTIGTATFDSDVKSVAISTSGGEADLTIGSTNADNSFGGATSLSVTSNGSAGITFTNTDIGSGSALASITVSANGSDAADITLGDVSGEKITTISLAGATGADVVVGTVNLGNVASATSQSMALSITQGQTSNVTVGAITVTGVGTLTIGVTQNGTAVADIDTIVLVKSGTADAEAQSLAFGAITVAGSGEVAINTIAATAAGTGAQISYSTITVASEGGFSAGAVTGTGANVNVDISDITVTVASSGSANFAGILGFDAGAVGARTITVGEVGSANFGAATASAIGAHTIVVATGAGVDIGVIVGKTGGSSTGGAVGAIEIAGQDDGDATFGTINASSLGAISVSGALNVTFGTITTTSVGGVDASTMGVSGAFTIDLSGVTNAVEVALGAASNTVISGQGNDSIQLKTGVTANDVIKFSSTAQGVDSIEGFFAGTTGQDQIQMMTGLNQQVSGGFRDADGVALVSTTTIALGAAITGTATLGTTGNVLVFATAFASTAVMKTFLQSAGAITFATADMDGSGNFLALWSDDGVHTIVSVIHFDSGADEEATLASATAVDIQNLAILEGVSPLAMAAVNIAIV